VIDTCSRSTEKFVFLVHNVYEVKGTSKVPKQEISVGLRKACSTALCNVLSQSSDLCSNNTLHCFYQWVFTVHVTCSWQLLNARTYLCSVLLQKTAV
jgi:hypothetical protein